MDTPKRVLLFPTCLVDTIFPQVAWATVDILEHAGVEIEVPDGLTCCGQPALNAGFRDDASQMARRVVDILYARELPVVLPSGSCTDMLLHQFHELFAGDAVYEERAARLAARTFELTQFLVDVLGVDHTAAARAGCVTYHPCCHGLRGLGLSRQPRALLAAIDARQVALADAESCCGFGGLFAVKMSEISTAMLNRKLDAIEASGADVVAVTDVSCAMHMAGGLHRRGSRVQVRHIAELLRPASR
jgi:L-lactate dehydrogenase complex protein LldE